MSYAASAKIVFADMLGTLEHLVRRAQGADFADSVLDAKLTEDMFPLELQFRVALNQILLALNQVGGGSVPLEQTPYRTWSDVLTGIETVRKDLEQVSADGWSDPTQVVDLTLPNGVRFVMCSEEDIRDWIMPNFYFHVTMAYVLLRHAGLSIGKMDYLRHMNRYLQPGANENR